MHIDMYSILVQIRISTLMILPDKVKVSSHINTCRLLVSETISSRNRHREISTSRQVRRCNIILICVPQSLRTREQFNTNEVQ